MKYTHPEDDYFDKLTEPELWKRYCGFLDLTVQEFMEIQENLLLDQIDRVWPSVLGKRIMGNEKPMSMTDFRSRVPFTSYEDYEPHLSNKDEDALACKPGFWCHSSGRMGQFKWFPHSPEFIERANKACVSIVALASTKERGKMNFAPGFHMLLVLPKAPYMSGATIDSMAKYISFRAIPPRDNESTLPFQQQVAAGFQIALKEGVDIITAIASVLVKMGEQFEEQARRTKFTVSMLHPAVLSRLIRAKLRARREHRPMLPRDLWPSKALVTSGMDTSIYKQAITRYWGAEPCEFYGCAEGLIIAMHGWNKNGLYFLPDIAFYEFIPEKEVQKWQADPSYQPSTVLYDEVEEGQLYEVVITQLYGMPLLRYRMKDIVKFTGMADKETGVRLPHIRFQRRVGETIDLAALARLDERTLWQALANTGLRYADWAATKEYDGDSTYLRLHIELKDGASSERVAELMDQNLKLIDVDYRDLESYLGLNPVKVTLLPPGTFDRYTDRQRAAGADLAHLKPPHVNASQDTVRALEELSQDITNAS
ncbi:MAG: GH3 auxin-responsive promoter family protein [Dehalococcoidia bacterium]|nr:GH3 auxin-responsive promoter family protein [Dehalococcoidia bacterium]